MRIKSRKLRTGRMAKNLPIHFFLLESSPAEEASPPTHATIRMAGIATSVREKSRVRKSGGTPSNANAAINKQGGMSAPYTKLSILNHWRFAEILSVADGRG